MGDKLAWNGGVGESWLVASGVSFELVWCGGGVCAGAAVSGLR